MQAGTPETVLSDQAMAKIAQIVYQRSGITLHDGKRSLVIARLQKRLRALGMESFGAYISHVERDASGEELTTLLDSIATNHTSFFREDQHFGFLASRIVPEHPGTAPLAVWSAACSTGEEPYTIAMTLDRAQPSREYGIVASDMSTKALATARQAVYKLAAVEKVPREILRQYFEKGLGAQDGLARVIAPLRAKVDFRRLNLLEITDLGQRFDVIFCRNVMIYFDRSVQQRVVSMLERHLRPKGYLFISHSESLNGISHQLRWVAPAIYQRGNA